MMWFESAASAALRQIAQRGQLRQLRPIALPGTHLALADGRVLLDFSSNDYLGLSQHPALKARAREWVARYGAGARASRLVSAALEESLAVEARLAEFKGTQSAITLSSGWQANASVLPALFALAGGRRALVFSDRMNHASIHFGCASVHQIRYHHLDYADLEERLQALHTPGQPCFILSETVFSMDGDRADVCRLAHIAQRHQALLYLDEAHATGVLGVGGRGLAQAALAIWPDTVIMGTLGKALGGAGAYIAGSKILIDFLINRCSGIIHSTALPPAAFGALDAALDLLPMMEAERASLAERGAALRTHLAQLGIACGQSSTHIVPVLLGDTLRAEWAQQLLQAAGIFTVAIRPPTVALGTSRLRLALSSAHSDHEFAQLLAALAPLSPNA